MRRFGRGRPLKHTLPLTILLLVAPAPLSRAAGTFDTQPAWTLEADQPGARLGSWVAPAGDVNGDGLSDVIVSAPFYGNGETHEGAIFVFYGRRDTGRLSPDWTLEGGQAETYLTRAAAAGDVNGDGFDDVVVAEASYSGGLSERGRVRVYYGSPDGLAVSPGWSMEGETASLYFGWSAGSAGDVNGDGFGDLVIGMRQQVRLFLGSPDGPGTTPDWSISGWLPTDSGRGPFGFDANGDGFDDLLVVEGYYDPVNIELYRGYPLGLRPRAHDSVSFPTLSFTFGIAYAPAGDTDHDGRPEFVAGFIGRLEVPNGSPCCPPEKVLLYEAGGQGFRQPGTLIHTTTYHRDLIPYGLDGAGDVNGDGFDDLIVTEYNVDPNRHGIQPIHVLVLAGSPSGAIGPPAAILDGFQIVDFFGESASRAGDFDGDGYADLLVGAPGYDDGETDEGAAFIYRGGPFASGP